MMAGAEFPRSTLEEALVLVYAMRDLPDPAQARIAPIPTLSPFPCDGCSKRTSNTAAFMLEGTSRFFCDTCVDAAGQYGLINRDDDGARLAGEKLLDMTIPSPPLAQRRGQTSPMQNFVDAHWILHGLATELMRVVGPKLEARGIKIPGPQKEARKLFDAMKHDLPSAVILAQGMVAEAMREAVPFLLPEGIADLLSLTDTPGTDDTARLPFPLVWLDGQFRFEDRTYYGLLAAETREGMPAFPFGEERKEDGTGPRRVNIAALYEDVHGRKGALGVLNALSKKREHLPLDLHTQVGNSEMRDLPGILQSWLYLLDSPQVATEKRVPSRREQDMHQRAVGIKAPSTIVHVKIVDRELVHSIERFRAGRARFSHAFWVRGHWRTLRSVTRFKENAGKRLWIAPFVKGEGILIEKTYQLDEDRDDQEGA